MLARTILLASVLALLASPAAARAPQAPGQAPTGFRLNEIEEAFLDQVLTQWQNRSGQIETFSCDFTRWEYDPVFGPGVNPATGQQRHKTVGSGTVSYQQPDKGSFQVKELKAWDAASQTYVANPNLIGEHWVCDGKSVFEYRQDQKQLVETPIPPELQGQNITDGPLPFLFGANKNKLKQRYWLKPDPQATAGTVWLNALPKTRADAANYREVDIMLDASQMLPYAMRVTAPDGSQTTYQFDLKTVKVNAGGLSQMWSQLFSAPRTPWGWKRVVQQPETVAGAPADTERR